MQSRMFFLRDLKEYDLLEILWKKGGEKLVCLRHLTGPPYNQFSLNFVEMIHMHKEFKRSNTGEYWL